MVGVDQGLVQVQHQHLLPDHVEAVSGDGGKGGEMGEIGGNLGEMGGNWGETGSLRRRSFAVAIVFR